VQDEIDEDSAALAEAIERSIIDQRNNDRYTIGGTDVEQLAEALERSKYEM